MKYLVLIICILCSSGAFAQASNLAADFEMKRLDGSTQNLKDLKGKVLYVSFWASWCAPCIQNFKKYNEVRKRLESEGVVLLNVSIDKSENAWRAHLEKQSINGINVLAAKEDLYPAYELSSIPLYEIINKAGQFVYLSDESNRDIIAQFKGWLEE